MLYILNERYQWGQMLVQHTPFAHKCICARTQQKQMQIYMKLEKNVSIQYHLSLHFDSYSFNQFPMSDTT